jgi:alpha-D-xyloside xylohydrolase
MRELLKGSFTALMILIVFAGFQKKENFTKKSDGVVINVNSLKVQLHVLGNKIIRVESITNEGPKNHQSLVVRNPAPERVKWDVKEESNALLLTTSSLQARIDLSSGTIQFSDISGNILLRENGREIIPVTLLDEKTNTIKQKFTLSADEAIFGLGQHQDGNINLRGKSIDLYQVNMKASLPMLVSSKGYGILWDNYSLSKFTDDSQGMELWSEVADGIDYYFIAGKNLDEVISGYRNVTGQAPLYGKWAYGFFQSKERYGTQDEILRTVDEFRKRQIPMDVIVQDWFYWDPQKWGSHYMDRKRYPDPTKMNDDVHNKNAKIIISVWAKFDSASPNFSELNSKGLLWKSMLDSGKYYNVYSAEARALYWKQMHDSLFVKGFDGWWLDASEPEIGDLRKNETKKLMNNELGTGARYLNTYPLMTTTAVYQGQRQTTSDKRVYILTRSAFAGQQRNAATTWSGDVTANWEVFHKQIPAGINFCYAGIPYWTTDIGAFFVNVPGGSKNDMYKELFTRWFQFGTFCPIFRVHGTSTPREMWRFGDKGSWAYDVQLRFDNLRYRLMPYLYSLAWKVTNENYTVMRGLVFDFAEDNKVYNIDDQFMFGPSILVNPVTEAMYHPWLEPDPGQNVTSEYILDKEGKGGLTGEYYLGKDFNKLYTTRSDPRIDFDWGSGGPLKGMTSDTFSIRWKGQLVPKETGEYTINTIADDGTRLFLNDQLLIDDWQDHAPQVASGKIFLEAGKKYDIKLEYYENAGGASVKLNWVKPSEMKDTTIKLPDKVRKVYLPNSKSWIDFWTGETIAGGQTINAPAPIEIMPLYIKAGSIIPMGPFIQYATEKPADPIELRVYPGANGAFVLYEDENDNYNYEKGAFAVIPFSWNDKQKTLTIGDRKGEFNGMLKERTFNVVLVSQSDGKGIEISQICKTIKYSGDSLTVKMN